MKHFNNAGPIQKDIHYHIDPLSRWDMDEMLFLINQRKYFILHAPRQTGKTSGLLALRDKLNAEGNVYAVYANIEAAQAARNNVQRGIFAILARNCDAHGVTPLAKKSFVLFINDFLNDGAPESALNELLKEMCKLLDKPFVLFLDEIDALVGDTLISVLRQIRAGYDSRPEYFPQSLILCGVRDIKDYRIHTSNQEIITGGSAFNIKSESLTLGNFLRAEVERLYTQHTETTGQPFAPECFDKIMSYTGGQPWLVNALAHEVTWKMKANRDRSVLITDEMIDQAKERLVLSRATHLDQLIDKLKEDRVRRVILPMILGEELDEVKEDDKTYCLDLGLIKKHPLGYQIANDIYRETIPRELTDTPQTNFLHKFQPDWVKADCSINAPHLIKLFRQFWLENREAWSPQMAGLPRSRTPAHFPSFPPTRRQWTWLHRTRIRPRAWTHRPHAQVESRKRRRATHCNGTENPERKTKLRHRHRKRPRTNRSIRRILPSHRKPPHYFRPQSENRLGNESTRRKSVPSRDSNPNLGVDLILSIICRTADQVHTSHSPCSKISFLFVYFHEAFQQRWANQKKTSITTSIRFQDGIWMKCNF